MIYKSNHNSFGTKSKLKSGLFYHSLRKIDGETVRGVSALPYSIKILLESVLRHENGLEVSRRGNDRVMTRGTFANITFRNQLAEGKDGGWTKYHPTREIMSIYEASNKYLEDGTPTIVLAGKDYGMGSSRDWAAKGTFLLGVKAIIAESFERIHRSNLVGMGVLPLQFRAGESCSSLDLNGNETYTIHINDDIRPGQDVLVEIVHSDGVKEGITVICRLDSAVEVEYYRHGGILHKALRTFVSGK